MDWLGPNQGRWRLTGFCAVDAKGNLGAFTADFPGQLSRFDGKHWQHHRIDCVGREPLELTADDRVLTYHAHRDLTFTVDVEKTAAGWKLHPDVGGLPFTARPCRNLQRNARETRRL